MTSKTVFSGREQGIKAMMAAMMEKEIVDALVLPMVQGDGRSVMPALVRDPVQVEQAILLGPAFFINTARMAARLSFKAAGKKTGIWMRPCEIRAFRELIKLNQATADEIVVMGMDCPMALDREQYLDWTAGLPIPWEAWAKKIFPDPVGVPVARACSVCTAPAPDHADLEFLFYGCDPLAPPQVRGGSPKGEAILESLSITKHPVPPQREAVLEGLVRERQQAFGAMAREAAQKTDSLKKLATYFAACINCYNCRTACPACYCRECVFNTDVFSHEPAQYHAWAKREGLVRMPSDTLFFHITRLAHMSHACVGCGQCTRACPQGIPVADLFSAVAKETQAAFNYEPGGDDPPPFTEFKTDEFTDAVG